LFYENVITIGSDITSFLELRIFNYPAKW